MKPLSVGDVVSAGLRIYRDNFKKYYKQAFIAALWSFIPVYGWAKYYAIQGLISRLAYREIIEQPETVRDANRVIKGRMWSFLGAAFLVGLRLFAIYVGGIIVLFLGIFLATFIVSFVLGFLGNTGSGIASIIAALLSIAGFIFLFSYIIRFAASLFVSELALAVEEDKNASQSLQRSQELTKGYLVNVVLILLIATLISFPLWGIIFALQMLSSYLVNVELPVPYSILYVLQLLFNAVTGALIIPFWQCVKAVIYYDLRVRREGMGIDLRK